MSEPFQMPQYVLDRVMNKRGKLHVFEALQPERTALLVIDMQNAFVKGKVKAETALAIMPTINRLAERLRAMGGRVAWVQLQAGKADGSSVAELYHKYFFTPTGAEGHRSSLTPGEWGYEICEELDVREEDLRAWKTRHSAFVHGHGNLHEQLQDLGIENLLIGGTVTNFCCETTGRDAMMLDYRAVMVSDCNAARFPEDHSAGLTTFFQSFGDVYTTDEVFEVLEKGRELQAST
ncbi:MAG: cysteine hydrolase [Gammaproteobacteria bacterium]|nr:cysteine hydrolase [Gammaproteobacteria bacterium]